MLIRIVILLVVLALGLAPARASHRVPAPRAHAAMAELVAAAATRQGVPARLALAVAAVESGFDPHARNGRSTGLMQVQPATARDAGCRGSLASPVANADCGARVLAVLLRDAGGDWAAAAARYNAGRFARGSAGRGYAARVLGIARRAARTAG